MATLLLISTLTAHAAPGDAPVVAARGDAYITHDGSSDLWTIGSRDLALTIGFDASRTLALVTLVNPAANRSWEIAREPDAAVTINGEHVPLRSRGATVFLSATMKETAQGVQLTFLFEHRASRVLIARNYVCYPGSPTIETWTHIDASRAAAPIHLSNLTAWTMVMPAGRVKWLGGLREDASDTNDEAEFALGERELADNERLEIGGDQRSSEWYVPFARIDNDRDEFFAGIQWSGSWRMAFERHENAMRVTADFPNIDTTVEPAQPLDLPHAFFGLTPRAATDATGALRAFITNGIRGGRPFRPLATYNTWFAYGTRIDEESMVSAIERAASVGIELFVLDAGWYPGAGAENDFDFGSGLGAWAADDVRFPSGLAHLSTVAHERGMLFGLWIEPERIALSNLNQPEMVEESWLATRDGSHESEGNAQICLTHPRAKAWLLDRISSLIDTVHPDYLKWDNNFWINCNRPGHGHGATDGSFTHVQALYSVLGEIRRRYPDLLIENVSGGGNRLDYGMLAYTDAAWMSDRSFNALDVRRNIEGLTAAFPPDYLLSFLLEQSGESVRDPDQMRFLVRSRLPAVFGVGFRLEELNDDDLAAEIILEINRFKEYRGLLQNPSATLLSAQAPVDSASWEVLQTTAGDSTAAVIYAFKGGSDGGSVLVTPRYLVPSLEYSVESIDAGPIGVASGRALMEHGIELVHEGDPRLRAHVIVIRARSPE